MSHQKGHHPGAVWRKTDFQVHTTRDAGWSGSPALPGGTAEAEAARDAWADALVAECSKRDIGAISITDHHDIAMYPYVERAIERSADARGRLWLFPGMEVTCDDSVQCLVLCDHGTAPEVLRRLFGMMPRVGEPSADEGSAPQADVCGRDIREFLGLVYEDATLRGKSIVLPHASRGGHKDILRKGFHSRFAELEVDGVYNEKHFDELDEQTRKKIYGEIKHWGDRRRGILTTGDNRTASYDRLARNACWVRLGEPTAESIRQALLADEARIAYSTPSIPSQRVLELRVSSNLTGASFELTFNDGFNALIGGRGSGKSAILEYLRFGLGRSTLDTADDETSDRERDLIKSTLVGGYVEVELERDGVRETWRRTLDKQAYISIRSEADEVIELPIEAAHERFRARAFSQKQLSTLVRRSESADEQITGIAAAESVDLRRRAEQTIVDRQREIQAAFQEVVRGWAAQAANERAAAAVADLRQRVDATRQRLEHGGLTPEQQTVLDQHPVFTRTAGQFATTRRIVEDKLKAIGSVQDIALDGWANTLDAPPVVELRAALSGFNARIDAVREQLRAILLEATAAVDEKSGEFQKLQSEYAARYEEASAAQAHLGTVLADYKRLSAELEQAEQRLQRTKEEEEKFAHSEVRLGEKRAALTDELTGLRRILNESAGRVEAMSEGFLRARVDEESVPKRLLDAFMELCERCSIRDLEERCAERVKEVSRNGGSEWEKLVQGLLGIRHALVRAGAGADLDPTLLTNLRAALGWELTDNQAKAVLARFDDARLGKFLSAWASPFVRFEYKDRGAYMPFERASPGQQASALLTLLLNQEAGTLIIDQPEDDLDNRRIMQIVKSLQKTKRKRQLIFATHNPNFVVNGDADKIVALTPTVEPTAPAGARAAQIDIETDGAIESPTVRKAITDTMEGGRDAFELRSRKYAFEPDAFPASAG